VPPRRTLRRLAIGLEGRGNAKQAGKPSGTRIVKTREIKNVALATLPVNGREL